MDGYEDDVDVTYLLDEKERNELRKACYRSFLLLWQGPLGRGKRMPLPSCVLDGVRSAFPNAEGNYMGYHNE